MRIAIIGSRSFDNYEYLKKCLLQYITKGSHIISGGASGADSLAQQFAKEHGLPITIYYPDWNNLGKKAGFIRNKTIIENSDLVVAFWDGESKGTKSSIDLAMKEGLGVIVKEF